MCPSAFTLGHVRRQVARRDRNSNQNSTCYEIFQAVDTTTSFNRQSVICCCFPASFQPQQVNAFEIKVAYLTLSYQLHKPNTQNVDLQDVT